MIYLAGRIIAQVRLRNERGRLRQKGFIVSSSWLDLAEPDYPATQAERDAPAWRARAATEAQNDLDEVRACSTFIQDTLDESNTGGREVELGVALVPGKTYIRIGPVRNIFHELADLSFSDWEAFWFSFPSLTIDEQPS